MNPQSDDWQQPDQTPNEHFSAAQAPQTPPDAPEVDIAQAIVDTPDGVDEVVRWTAPEYYTPTKGVTWYVVYGLTVLVFMAIAIFVLKSILFAVLIVIMAFSLFLYVNRPPRTIQYSLSRKGIHVDDHLHEYSEFREFGLLSDDPHSNTISLIPRRRFAPSLTFHFPDEAGEAIVDMLAARLPMKDIHEDYIDKLFHLLRI